MPGLLINIDVPDIQEAVDFYTSALELRVGRRFGDDFLELVGADVPLYLLQKGSGTSIGPAGGDKRRYDRHWSPIHLDFVVPDLDVAVARVTSAGAVQEGETCEAAYGRLAMFADPFGNGFCLIEFNGRGYDAIADHGGRFLPVRFRARNREAAIGQVNWAMSAKRRHLGHLRAQCQIPKAAVHSGFDLGAIGPFSAGLPLLDARSSGRSWGFGQY